MIGIVQWFLKAKNTQGFREGAGNYARGRAWSPKKRGKTPFRALPRTVKNLKG